MGMDSDMSHGVVAAAANPRLPRLEKDALVKQAVQHEQPVEVA